MKTMQFLGVGLALSIVSTLPLLADQPVDFSNAGWTGGASRLVTFGSTFGALAGSGVRNGIPGGYTFVAQLFWRDPEGRFNPVGQVAEFGDGVTTAPGTWLGGIRTINGVERGTPLQLAVVFWDAAFLDAGAARSASRGFGSSGIFTFQDKLTNPADQSDIAIDNFWGAQIGGLDMRLPWDPVTPEPTTVALAVVGLISLLWLPKRR
jgi:hypothetical protein